MYPSGDWVGHWDQNGLGRQEMRDLTISFDQSRLSGQGWDKIGQFTLTGEILADNKVQITKKYLNRHSVVYLGEHDGEGMIYGAWALAGDQGTFAMRPAGGFRSSDLPIQDLLP